jgi:hypothetical protein
MPQIGAQQIGFSKTSKLPPKRTKLSESAEVPLVDGPHCDAYSAGTHRNECIIGQSPLADLFVIIFFSKAGKHPGRPAPSR